MIIRHRLTELEVFMGMVMGKNGGMPSKRAREAASSLRERFNEVVSYTVQWIQEGDEESDEEVLARSLACFNVAIEDRPSRRGQAKLRSFGYLAGVGNLESGKSLTTQRRGILKPCIFCNCIGGQSLFRNVAEYFGE